MPTGRSGQVGVTDWGLVSSTGRGWQIGLACRNLLTSIGRSGQVGLIFGSSGYFQPIFPVNSHVFFSLIHFFQIFLIYLVQLLILLGQIGHLLLQPCNLILIKSLFS